MVRTPPSNPGSILVEELKSHMTHVCQAASAGPDLVRPWTVAYQAPVSVGSSRREYCSGLPRPPRGIFPPRDEPTSPMSPASAGRFFTTSATWATPDMTRDVAKIKKTFKKKRKTEKENHRLIVSVASAPLSSDHHPQSPLGTAVCLFWYVLLYY